MNDREAYIVDGIRTPIGSLKGALAPVRADDLAALVMKNKKRWLTSLI
jgi:acetyl-CoA acetyltransferase